MREDMISDLIGLIFLSFLFLLEIFFFPYLHNHRTAFLPKLDQY